MTYKGDFQVTKTLALAVVVFCKGGGGGGRGVALFKWDFPDLACNNCHWVGIILSHQF